MRHDVLPGDDFGIHAGTRIGTVSLGVSDLVRSASFYQDVLGFQLVGRPADGRVLLGATAGVGLLELVEMPGATLRPRRSTGLYHFAILVPTRRDLGRSLRRLLQCGQPVPGSSDHLVSEALYLADPDGNGIEIYRDRPRGEWAWDGSEVRMAVDPLDLRALLAEADDAPWTGLAAGTTIGHVHLHVADIETAGAFYHGLLGFDITCRSLPGALFVSAGGYHHHLGVNIWAGAGAPPPPPTAVGLRHYEIVLPAKTDLARLVARLEVFGHPIDTADADRIVLRDPFEIGIMLRSE